MKKNDKTLIIYIIYLLFASYIILPVIFKDGKTNKIELKTSESTEYKNIVEEYGLMYNSFDIIPAQVIFSTLGVGNIIKINKGLENGLSLGQTVINSSGYVGEIIKVYNDYSLVRLIFSDNTAFPVEIEQCYGTLFSKNNKLVVRDLVNCTNISEDSAVFTSKYSFASNVHVGNVSEVYNEYFTVKPSINKYELKYVGVINDNN